MFKKLGIVMGLIVLIATISLVLFIYRLVNMAHSIEGELARVSNIDLAKIADGTYHGSYGNFVVFASVEVSVKNHRIESVVIKQQGCAQGYEAKDTASRIVKAQSAKVDAVTGASSSSRTIMVAVGRALGSK